MNNLLMIALVTSRLSESHIVYKEVTFVTKQKLTRYSREIVAVIKTC